MNYSYMQNKIIKSTQNLPWNTWRRRSIPNNTELIKTKSRKGQTDKEIRVGFLRIKHIGKFLIPFYNNCACKIACNYAYSRVQLMRRLPPDRRSCRCRSGRDPCFTRKEPNNLKLEMKKKEIWRNRGFNHQLFVNLIESCCLVVRAKCRILWEKKRGLLNNNNKIRKIQKQLTRRC